VLLIVGALISSYLVPSFTRKWQDHQKALELKTDMASQMTQASTSMILTSRFRHFGAGADRGGQAWRAWQIRGAVIEARLRAYFPDTRLATDWHGFTLEVVTFYNFASSDAIAQRALWCVHASLLSTSVAVATAGELQTRGADRLRNSVSLNCTATGELPITKTPRPSAFPAFETEWAAVERELYDRRNELVGKVLDSHVKAF
jgi:hypothetical protein